MFDSHLDFLNISPLQVALFCRDRVDELGACHSFLFDLRMHIGAYSYPTQVRYLFAPGTSVTFPKDWGQYRLRYCSFLLYANAMSSIITESWYRVSHHGNIVSFPKTEPSVIFLLQPPLCLTPFDFAFPPLCILFVSCIICHEKLRFSLI